MERFLKRHTNRLLGSISGFDRVLFRGTLRSIRYAQGLDYFMGSQRVGFKDFTGLVEKFSAGVKARAEQIARRAGRPFLYVPSGQASKEALAREVLKRDGIEEGLICVLSCVEPCPAFSVRRDRASRQWQLLPRERKCLHLYFYILDRDFGLMHIRLQTWLPLTIPVCVNGREWLARQMRRAGIEHEQKDNCFTRIADLPGAQALMDRLVELPWAQLLNRWARRVNPWLAPRGTSAPARLLRDGAAGGICHGRDVSPIPRLGHDLSSALPASHRAIRFAPGPTVFGATNQPPL